MKKILVVMMCGVLVLSACGKEDEVKAEKNIEIKAENGLSDKNDVSDENGLLDENGVPINFYEHVEHANYEEVLEVEGDNLYYFYQATCSHCNALKPVMYDFDEDMKEIEDKNLYFVDLLDPVNEEAWGEADSTENVEDMKELEDIKIKGTPTMIHVVDKVVVDYGIGGEEIEVMIEEVLGN